MGAPPSSASSEGLVLAGTDEWPSYFGCRTQARIAVGSIFAVLPLDPAGDRRVSAVLAELRGCDPRSPTKRVGGLGDFRALCGGPQGSRPPGQSP